MSNDESQKLTIEKLKKIKAAYKDELMSKANVQGVGIGFRQKNGLRTDSLAIVVMVDQKLPESQLTSEDLVPGEIEGMPVDIQETGQIRAQL